MTRSVYIASSLLNKERVQSLRDRLRGLDINITYDWTTHGLVQDRSLLPGIARQELDGVLAADCILLVMPARMGSHFEAGAAYAAGKPIVMLLEDEATHTWVSFHLLPGITKCSNEDEAIAAVLDILSQTNQHSMESYDVTVAQA